MNLYYRDFYLANKNPSSSTSSNSTTVAEEINKSFYSFLLFDTPSNSSSNVTESGSNLERYQFIAFLFYFFKEKTIATIFEKEETLLRILMNKKSIETEINPRTQLYDSLFYLDSNRIEFIVIDWPKIYELYLFFNPLLENSSMSEIKFATVRQQDVISW